MPKWSLLEKLIGNGKIVILTVENADSHIDCREWLILQELSHTLYASHLEGPQFSDLVAECEEILAGMVKMLESRAIKAVDNPELESKVYDKPESKQKVIAELV